MLISYKQSIFTIYLSPQCSSCSPIQLVTELKYLGMLFSSSLSWSNHIIYLSSKNHKLIDLLYHHLLLFFASTLLSSVLILNSVLSFGTLNLLTSHLILKKIQFVPVNFVVIIDPQTTLCFSLSFIFLRYLLTTTMLNFSFSLNFS